MTTPLPHGNMDGPMPTAYLAGPDVFFADAEAHAAAKQKICLEHGIIGLAPLDSDVIQEGQNDKNATQDRSLWRAIFDKNIDLMERSCLVIANVTPFRGVSADAGTLMEIGWFWGRGRGVFAYSNATECFGSRNKNYVSKYFDKDAPAIEDFSLPENLMLIGAVRAMGGTIITPRDVPMASRSAGVESGGYLNLTTFAAAVKEVASSEFVREWRRRHA